MFVFDASLPLDPEAVAPVAEEPPQPAPKPRRPRRTVSPVGVALLLAMAIGAGSIVWYVLNR